MKYWVLLIILLSQMLLFGQDLHLVRPSDTDNNINTNDQNHYAYFNSDVEEKEELFLFLPGTGGLPRHYSFILKHAANLGYHSIGLTYPNDRTINGLSICGLTIDTTCHSRARHEVFDGIDRHDQVDVDPGNSIKNRLLKLIIYLEQEFPNENWDQYINGDEIHWEKIKIAGHSQGGGHAGFIATLVPVERAIMIGINDRIGLLGRSADWISREGETSNNRYFGFLHEQDELVDFENAVEGWIDRGMLDQSNLVNIDTLNTPYNNSKTLSTNILPRNNVEKYHNSIAVDLFTPLNENGDPVLGPVWTHLIASPIEISSNVKEDINLDYYDITVYPNPTIDFIQIEFKEFSNQNFQTKIYNLQGHEVFNLQIHSKIERIDLAQLPESVYILAISENDRILHTRMLYKSN